MPLEFVSPDFVQGLISRIGSARSQAIERFDTIPPPGADSEAQYWENVLEANAALVLASLTRTRLPAGFVVRYRFFEKIGGDLRLRPFVARETTDVATAKRLLDWHPPPDTQTPGATGSNYRDVELLYRHFTLTRTAEGVFEYWFAMQEIWASTKWAHARVLASASDLAQIIMRDGWQSEREIEHCAPAVVTDDPETSNLAVFVYSPLHQERVTLERIEIGADRAIRYGEPVLVARGPKGYVL